MKIVIPVPWIVAQSLRLQFWCNVFSSPCVLVFSAFFHSSHSISLFCTVFFSTHRQINSEKTFRNCLFTVVSTLRERNKRYNQKLSSQIIDESDKEIAPKKTQTFETIIVATAPAALAITIQQQQNATIFLTCTPKPKARIRCDDDAWTFRGNFKSTIALGISLCTAFNQNSLTTFNRSKRKRT